MADSRQLQNMKRASSLGVLNLPDRPARDQNQERDNCLRRSHDLSASHVSLAP